MARNQQTSAKQKKLVGTEQYKRIPVSICQYLATASLWYNLSVLFQTHEPYNTHSACLPDLLRKLSQMKVTAGGKNLTIFDRSHEGAGKSSVMHSLQFKPSHGVYS